MSAATAAGASEDAALAALLRQLEPVRNTGVYRFATVAPDTAVDMARCVCIFREPEGLSIIAAEQDLPAQATISNYRAGWITLRVASALAGVGLTAAVATRLADAGISCNVVAGTHHDHLFVPIERTEDAMTCLRTMQRHATDR